MKLTPKLIDELIADILNDTRAKVNGAYHLIEHEGRQECYQPICTPIGHRYGKSMEWAFRISCNAGNVGDRYIYLSASAQFDFARPWYGLIILREGINLDRSCTHQ